MFVDIPDDVWASFVANEVKVKGLSQSHVRSDGGSFVVFLVQATLPEGVGRGTPFGACFMIVTLPCPIIHI